MRIGRCARRRDALKDVVGAAQDADQIARPELSTRAHIGQQLIAHAGRRGRTVGPGAAEGVVDAARNRRAGGIAPDIEAQQFGENRPVRESSLIIGRRGRGRSARRGIEVAVVGQAVAEHDQTVVALRPGSAGG
ncbi:hypothetical protein D3C85_1431680 [compost metagenome]